MKTKIIIGIIAFTWVSCSSTNEKKSEKNSSDEEVKEESAPTEEAGYDDQVENAPVEEMPEEVIQDLKESNKASQKTNSSNPFPKDQRGMGVGSEGYGDGSGDGMGSGSGVKKKSIEVKSDITVGEEGVR